MVRRVLGRFLLLLLIMMLFFVTNSWAVEINGRSSTQLLWFNDFYNGRQTEFAQYLRIAARNVDQAGKFSVYGYGRGGAILERADESDDRASGRLYYLYGDWRDIDGKLDIKVGRQFTNLSAETALIDGALLDIKKVGPLGLTFLGGRPVVFGLNGEIGHEGDYAVGLAAYLQGRQKTDLDISWFRKWDQHDLARDLLGASFKQYLWDNTKLYGNARYDLTSEAVSELLGGIKFFRFANLSLTGEYFQSYPIFDTTSIFSVFAVNLYKEALLRAEYALSEQITLYGGYTRQDFGDEDGWGNVYILGYTLRPRENLTIDLDFDRRNGVGGSLNGGTINVHYDATKELRLGAGIAYDVYQRDNMTGQQTARNYWLGSRYKLAQNMAASVRVENSVNKTYERNTQGRFVFDYDF